MAERSRKKLSRRRRTRRAATPPRAKYAPGRPAAAAEAPPAVRPADRPQPQALAAPTVALPRLGDLSHVSGDLRRIAFITAAIFALLAVIAIVLR